MTDKCFTVCSVLFKPQYGCFHGLGENEQSCWFSSVLIILAHDWGSRKTGNKSVKQSSHERSMPHLPSAASCCLTTWRVSSGHQNYSDYSNASLCLNAAACVFTSFLMLFRPAPWLTFHCCLLFSDIPRIPDTSHPPLESSKFLPVSLIDLLILSTYLPKT